MDEQELLTSGAASGHCSVLACERRGGTRRRQTRADSASDYTGVLLRHAICPSRCPQVSIHRHLSDRILAHCNSPFRSAIAAWLVQLQRCFTAGSGGSATAFPSQNGCMTSENGVEGRFHL